MFTDNLFNSNNNNAQHFSFFEISFSIFSWFDCKLEFCWNSLLKSSIFCSASVSLANKAVIDQE